MPDLTTRPSPTGTFAFYLFDEPLVRHQAVKLTEEIKASASLKKIGVLNVDLILDLHAVLQGNKKDHVLGDELPYQSLALFLGFLHNRAAPGWDTSALREVVVAILNDVKILNKHHPVPSMQTPSEEPDESAGQVAFILVLRQTLCEIEEYMLDQAKQIREQHGGIEKHLSIDDLMSKIENWVDKTALVALVEQVFAIHAE